MHARTYKIINENYTYRWHMVKKPWLLISLWQYCHSYTWLY